MARYRLNVDYTSATQVDESGHPAFVPNVALSSGPSGAANSITNPMFVNFGQGTPTNTTATLVAATAATVLAANASARGVRILNWTAAATYIHVGVAGTPASGAPSDYIPAAAGGVPGQWESPYAPVAGLRAVNSAGGDLTIVSW